jgi:FlaA1/EpsC-like NDP-sugar epimerase
MPRTWLKEFTQAVTGRHAHDLRVSLLGLPRPLKRALLVAADVVLMLGAAILAIYLTHPAVLIAGPPWGFLLALGVVMVLVFWALGLYQFVVRFLRSEFLKLMVTGVTVAAAMMALYGAWRPESGVTPAAALVFWAFGILYMGGSRVAARDFLLNGGRTPRERAIIYGAGVSGARLASLLAPGGDCRPAAFVDDDATLHGKVVAGLSVHSPADLGELIATHDATRLLLAIPSASRQRRAQIVDALRPFSLHIQTVPDMNDLVSGKASFDELREVELEDLLGRDPVPPRTDLISACIKGLNVMVTGAGGSIGSELCRQIIGLGASRLVLVDHSEAALYQIDQELRARVEDAGLAVDVVPVLASVTEKDFFGQTLRSFDVHTVYHAAAYKHVPLVEHNMGAGIRNNVLGTFRAAEAAEEAGVQTFVLVSTDKAVNPTNVMGATKRFAEMILQGMVGRGTSMRICMVRFGNVLASSGSVVPLFREQIRRGGPVTVTHPEIVRYFMTISEAAQLVIQAGAMGRDGEVFLLDMGAPVKIVDLARKMIQLSGLELRDAANPDGDIEIVFTGLRPAEKLYEELLVHGNNAVGTDHPRIWKANEHGAPWGAVCLATQAISKAVIVNDCDAMRRILLEVVREYVPPPEFADHVYRATRGLPKRAGADIVELHPARPALVGPS